MRFFNALLMASAVAVASVMPAEAVKTGRVHKDFVPKYEMPDANFLITALRPKKTVKPVQNKIERLDKTDGIPSLEGTWTFIVGDNYFEGSAGYVAAEFNATVNENNMVTFTSVSGEYYPLEARFYPRTNALTFNRKMVMEEDGSAIFQEPFTYNWEEESITKGRVVAYYSEYNNSIVFNDDLGIAWIAYADKAGSQVQGYADMLDLTVFYRATEDKWNDVGNALFTDGWLVPGFGDNTLNSSYEVPLQQSATNENLYRLVNPYKYGPLAATNECTHDGYIVFDVTDPDHVIFKFADAGYANKEKGCSMFFAYNYYGIVTLINPFFTPEELLAELGEEYPYTTYKNGVLSFNNSMKLPDTRFGLQFPPTFGYYWQNADGNPAPMNASVVMPEAGIGGISVNAGEVEYFNLQGIRVINPEPGQILIKRQGNSVTKEIVK